MRMTENRAAKILIAAIAFYTNIRLLAMIQDWWISVPLYGYPWFVFVPMILIAFDCYILGKRFWTWFFGFIAILFIVPVFIDWIWQVCAAVDIVISILLVIAFFALRLPSDRDILLVELIKDKFGLIRRDDSEKVASFLREHGPLRYTEFIGSLAQDLDVSESCAQNMIKQAREEGIIAKEDGHYGKYYFRPENVTRIAWCQRRFRRVLRAIWEWLKHYE